FFFDFQSASNSLTYWRLLDPFGRAVFGPKLMTGASGDVDVTTLAFTGTYTLLIEGQIGAGTDTTSYRFNAQRIADDVTPLEVGHRDGGQAFICVDAVDRGGTGGLHPSFGAVSNANPLLIGRTLEAFGNFEGTIDEVRVWNVGRSQAQIVAAKDAELVGTEAGLMMYLKANEGTGAVLNDATGVNNAQMRNVYGV